jgi:hypothetical protein
METPAKLLLSFVSVLVVLSSLPSVGATYVVDRLTDTNPSGGGQGSGLAGDLRYAITNAQSGDRITLNVTGTINLNGALPSLTRNIRIEGPGANSLTVHGGGHVFVVGSLGSSPSVVLSGLTITGGVGNGGGIFNFGTLTLNNATISGNVAGDPTDGGGTGPGIWNYVNASLTLNNCTISGNSAIGNLSYAASRGGGIANYGTLTLNNSTVSGNAATQGSGGGVYNIGTLTLNNSTVRSNSATAAGGGIDNHSTLNARNTIVAGNTGTDLSGNLTSQGHNLFGTTSGSGFDPTDQVNVNPVLGPLQDNGGPTPTMAPLPGSPAIDRIPGMPGVDFPPTDQRGISRPQGILADIGAVEVGPQVDLPMKVYLAAVYR